MVNDNEMTQFLTDVVGVVDTTSYEKHMLWVENQRRDKPMTWDSSGCGLMETVGILADMPVCVTLFTAVIAGQKILFLDATSKVVDYRMIEQWLLAVLPKSAYYNGYVNRTDAMNFHNVFRR